MCEGGITDELSGEENDDGCERERRLYTHSLMYSCHVADVRVAGIALCRGADPNGLARGATTPLHAVCLCSSYWDPTRRAEQRTKIAKMLLDRGADVNVLSGKERMTPLHIAVWSQLPEIVAILIDAGADVNLADNSQNGTPLAIALHSRNVRIIKLLLETGADPWNVEKGLSAKTVAQTLLCGDQLDEVEKMIDQAILCGGAHAVAQQPATSHGPR